jgi:methionyl-tRNA formyltransferase
MAGPFPLLFLGSKPLGLRLMEELAAQAQGRLAAVATCDDTADDRGCLPAFRAAAAARALPFEILAPKAVSAWIERWRPYAVLVCGWYWKIPAAALAMTPGGVLGLHASLLPRYRGNAPLVWALLNGENEAGVSLFRMEEGMDTGDLLAQERFPLGPDETIADALAKAETASLAALREALPGLLAGQPRFRPQAPEGVSVFPKRSPADGRLDWNAPAPSVHNAIRAQTRPYPGAFAFLGDRKMIVWSSARERASGDQSEALAGDPGRVLEAGPGGALVACGQGMVRLKEIQFEGEAPADAGERLAAGDQLA